MENIDLGGGKRISFREKDPSPPPDDWGVGDIGKDSHFQAAIGLDSNQQWEAWMEDDTKVGVFLAGYTRRVQMDVHADIDIRLLDSGGTEKVVGPFPITDKAPTANITGTDWQTLTGTYVFPGCDNTECQKTDYLEITLFVETTSNNSEETISVDFRIDDPSIPVASQTRVLEVLP